MCFIDERTDPAYRKPVSRYTFIFNATNRLKPEGTITVEQVDHYAIGKICYGVLVFLLSFFHFLEVFFSSVLKKVFYSFTLLFFGSKSLSLQFGFLLGTYYFSQVYE